MEVVHKSSAAKDSAFSAALNYVWSGNVLECSNCGVIFRDREKWQGNLDPERAGVVTPEVTHIWPGQRSIQGKLSVNIPCKNCNTVCSTEKVTRVRNHVEM